MLIGGQNVDDDDNDFEIQFFYSIWQIISSI